jgi:predicted transcriptional regulator
MSDSKKVELQKAPQRLNITKRVREVLAEAGEAMQGYKIASRVGITTRKFNQRAADMVAAGQIQRVRKMVGGRSGYWYSLSVKQAVEVRLENALEEIRTGQLVDNAIPDHEIPSRLGFLRMLKEKTVFRDHVIVDLMIADYERSRELALSTSS